MAPITCAPRARSARVGVMRAHERSQISHFIWSLTPFRKWSPSNLRQNGLGQRHRLWFDLWNRNARAPNVDGEIGLAFFHAERILLAIRRCRVVSLVA